MTFKENQNLVLRDLWETYKEDLESIEIWGTAVLPWNLDSKDVDVVFIAKNEEIAQRLFSIMWTWLEKAHKNNMDYIIHTRETLNKNIKDMSFEYQIPYVITPYGTPYAYKCTKPSKKALAKKVKKLESLIISGRVSPKRWYHIWITLCLIENNFKDLTEKQIEEARILKARDKQHKEEIEKIKAEIKAKLDL